MSYERLFGAASALDDVYEIVRHEALHARHDVYVVQTEIGVAKDHPLSPSCELCRQTGGDGGLAHAALTRRYDDFSCHSCDFSFLCVSHRKFSA